MLSSLLYSYEKKS